MGGNGNKKTPATAGGRTGKPSPAPVKHDDVPQDDVEDGDIATPKQDLEGDDDQPL